MPDNFFDSNVLLYLMDDDASCKRDIAQRLVDRALKTRDSAISFQVAQETLNVMTRAPAPATAAEAERFLRKTLMPLWKVHPSPALYLEAVNIQSRYQYSFYDSLIIAAALELECKTLYTEDMQHGQHIDQLTIKNPFQK